MLEAASAKKGGFGRAVNNDRRSRSNERSIHMSRAASSSSHGPSLEELAGFNDSKSDSGSFSIAGEDDLDLDDLDASSNV